MLWKYSFVECVLVGVSVTMVVVSASFSSDKDLVHHMEQTEWSQSPGDELVKHTQKEKSAHGCCYPEVFETMFFESMGYHDVKTEEFGFIQNFVNMSCDSKVKKAALDELIISNGDILHMKLILDFNQHRMYIIYSNDNCTYEPYHEKYDACIPENATKIAHTYLGVGNEDLAVDSWTYQIGKKPDPLKVIFSVTSEQCAPVGLMANGIYESLQLFLSGGYSNMTLGIKDPSVFDPPEGCKPVAEEWQRVAQNPIVKLMKYMTLVG